MCKLRFCRCYPSVFVLALLCLWLSPRLDSSLAYADELEQAVSIDSVQVGLGGIARIGTWTPITVSLSGQVSECELAVETTDPAGNPFTVSCNIPGEASKVTLHTIFGRLITDFEVRILSPVSAQGPDAQTNAGIIASRRLSSDSSTSRGDFKIVQHKEPMWLVVGAVPAVAEDREKADAEQAGESSNRALNFCDVLASANEFPSESKTLAAYDTIVISGDFDFSRKQSQVLRRWTLSGGHLLCAIGSRAESFRKSQLQTWLKKIKVDGPKRLNDVAEFESWVGSTSRIPFAQRITGSTITATKNDLTELVSTLKGNLVVRTAVGAGKATLLGIDLDRRPFSNWKAKRDLLLKLGDRLTKNETAGRRTGRFSRTGISELNTQMQMGLEAEDSANSLSPLSILSLILVYLLVIGPGDFALVHRLIKSPKLTWGTFPGLVLLTAFVANLTASSQHDSDVSVNQLEFVDIDTQSGFVREKTWFTVFSPENRRYKIGVKPGKSVLGKRGKENSTGIRWAGLPESSYGGMYRQAGFELGKPSYHVDGEFSALANVPIANWSNRLFESVRFGENGSNAIDHQLRKAGNGQLTKTSRFWHNLSGPLKDWIVAYGSRVYYYNYAYAQKNDLPASDSTIKPGEEWAADSRRVASKQLNTFLTGTSINVVKGWKNNAEVAYEQTRYDTRQTDLLPIVRMVSLHEHAGGQKYTTLVNHSLREFELSDSLKLDRALIIGIIDQPANEIYINGKNVKAKKLQTFVRIIVPVLDKDAIRRSLPRVR